MKSATSRSLWLRLGIFYAVIFGIILILAYLGRLPGFLTHLDKPGHVILYGVFTFLGHHVWPQKRLWRLPIFPVLFGIFTTVEELSQSLSPNRTLDAGDLICSFTGIAIGYGLAQYQIAQRQIRGGSDD